MANRFHEPEDDVGMTELKKQMKLVVRAEALAESLLDLLTEYLEVADQWEVHYSAANSGELNKAEEKADHADIQTHYMVPFMERCVEEGWAYSDMVAIIPGSFKTTSGERWATFKDLRDWAFDEYGLVPF